MTGEPYPDFDDAGYAAWADELDRERQMEIANETLDAMRDNKCSREDYLEESEDE